MASILMKYLFSTSGVGLATNSSSRQLKKECASILENIKVKINTSVFTGFIASELRAVSNCRPRCVNCGLGLCKIGRFVVWAVCYCKQPL